MKFGHGSYLTHRPDFGHVCLSMFFRHCHNKGNKHNKNRIEFTGYHNYTRVYSELVNPSFHSADEDHFWSFLPESVWNTEDDPSAAALYRCMLQPLTVFKSLSEYFLRNKWLEVNGGLFFCVCLSSLFSRIVQHILGEHNLSCIFCSFNLLTPTILLTQDASPLKRRVASLLLH